MKKNTTFFYLINQGFQRIPNKGERVESPSEASIRNILNFAGAYDVQRVRSLEKPVELILN